MGNIKVGDVRLISPSDYFRDLFGMLGFGKSSPCGLSKKEVVVRFLLILMPKVVWLVYIYAVLKWLVIYMPY